LHFQCQSTYDYDGEEGYGSAAVVVTGPATVAVTAAATGYDASAHDGALTVTSNVTAYGDENVYAGSVAVAVAGILAVTACGGANSYAGPDATAAATTYGGENVYAGPATVAVTVVAKTYGGDFLNAVNSWRIFWLLSWPCADSVLLSSVPPWPF
jgi:hypothetical protein